MLQGEAGQAGEAQAGGEAGVNGPAMAVLLVLAAVAFIAWFWWSATKTTSQVLIWSVATTGIAALAAGFTWAAGYPSNVLTNAFLGALCAALAWLRSWVIHDLLDRLRKRQEH